MTKTIERGIPLPPDIVDDFTRREFLVAAGLIALAPGCGNDGESGEDTSRETRTVEHASGTTEVPVRPALVATSFTEAATNLALLGLAPLTGPDFIREYMDSYAGFLPDSLEIDSIKLVGQITEPHIVPGQTVEGRVPVWAWPSVVENGEVLDRSPEKG